MASQAGSSVSGKLSKVCFMYVLPSMTFITNQMWLFVSWVRCFDNRYHNASGFIDLRREIFIQGKRSVLQGFSRTPQQLMVLSPQESAYYRSFVLYWIFGDNVRISSHLLYHQEFSVAGWKTVWLWLHRLHFQFWKYHGWWGFLCFCMSP